MSSRPFQGVAYERLPYEDVDVIFDDNLDNDLILRNDGFPDRQHVESSLLRKLDLRMSILFLMWAINYIDRLSVSFSVRATVQPDYAAFEEDLRLEGQQFNTILCVFYIGYTLLQVPSNMLLDKIGRPSLYLPASMVIWGLTLVLMGTTIGFIGAMCSNLLLGFAEAPFYPGALLILSKWYKRREVGQRIAILCCGDIVSSAFGPLLASVIMDSMDGVMGQAAWRWLFYIQGSMTILLAICAIFILPDFPATPSSWLTAEEQALVRLRMEEDIGGNNEEETEDFKGGASALRQALSDWKVWWLALVMTSINVMLSFTAFFPTLSATLGYSPTLSLLLCAPPGLIAICSAFLVSRHSDEAGERFGHLAVTLLVGIMGFLMAMATMDTVVRYLSLFFMAQSRAAPMIFFAWASNSFPFSASKRAVALAFINAFASLGDIMGSYIWQKSWGPSYWDSYLICVGAGALCIVMSWVFRRHLMKLNREMETKMNAGHSSEGFTYLL